MSNLLKAILDNAPTLPDDNGNIMPVYMEKVEKSDDGYWRHSHLPSWTEDTSEQEMDEWFASRGLKPHFVFFEDSIDDEEIQENVYNGDRSLLKKWNPVPPVPNAFLLSIHETERDVTAMFGEPITTYEN